MQNAARITSPSRVPAACRSNPNGMVTHTMRTACANIGTISLRARPMSRAGRRSGVTSIRSCEPVWISYSRLDPVIDVPNRQDITTMPGTNHCRADSPATTSGSNGAKRPRKTSGWTMLKTIVNGSRSSGRSSRLMTVAVSLTSVVLMRGLLLEGGVGWAGRSGRAGPSGGAGGAGRLDARRAASQWRVPVRVAAHRIGAAVSEAVSRQVEEDVVERRTRDVGARRRRSRRRRGGGAVAAAAGARRQRAPGRTYPPGRPGRSVPRRSTGSRRPGRRARRRTSG